MAVGAAPGVGVSQGVGVAKDELGVKVPIHDVGVTSSVEGVGVIQDVRVGMGPRVGTTVGQGVKLTVSVSVKRASTPSSMTTWLVAVVPGPPTD